MSFEFNQSLLNDLEFNRNLKDKLTLLLTNSLVKTNQNHQNDYINLKKDITLNNDINNNTSNVVQSYGKLVNSKAITTNGGDNFTKESSPNTKTRTNITANTNTPVNRDSLNNSKISFIKNQVKINVVDFPIVPQVEILDIDITTQPRSLIKAIGKLSCQKTNIEMETNVESNLLMLSLEQTPSFIKPKLIVNDSLLIPVTMNFKNINLELITNLFMRNYGISMSFNDVIFDFDFDCSIKLLQNTIEQKLKFSIISFFKDLLPQAIFNKSKNWFNQKDENYDNVQYDSKNKQSLNHDHLVTFDENDFQDFSIKNMTRLSNIHSSRQTLSLHGTTELNNLAIINNCLERQNLHRFISRIPNLQNVFNIESNNSFKNLNKNYYTFNDNYNVNNSNRNDENLLPKYILDNNLYDLNSILSIQEKLFQRSNNFKIKKNNILNKDINNDNIHDSDNYKPKRRVIKLFKNKSKKIVKDKQDNTTIDNVQVKTQLNSNIINDDDKFNDAISTNDEVFDSKNVLPRANSTIPIDIKHVSPKKLKNLDQYALKNVLVVDTKLNKDDIEHDTNSDTNRNAVPTFKDKRDLLTNIPVRRISSPSLRSLNNHNLTNTLNPINFVGLNQSSWGQINILNNNEHDIYNNNSNDDDLIVMNSKPRNDNTKTTTTSPPHSPPPYSVNKI